MARITDIEIGERRREDMGDIAGLAESLKKYGLLHPIIVDEELGLIAGHRRLEAAKSLGWEDIDVRYKTELTENEKREIELEENGQRKDLTDYEKSKAFLAKAQKTAQALSSNLEDKKPRGHKRTMAAPKEDVARALDTGVGTIVRNEQHVATAEEYPFMQKPDWKQYHVLEAREAINKIPEESRATIAEMVSEPAIPPKLAISLIKNVSNMKPQESHEVCQLYKSEDSRDRSLAKAKAAQLPPEPDPRLFPVSDAISALQKCVKQFPCDPLLPKFKILIQNLESLKKEIREVAKREQAKTNY